MSPRNPRKSSKSKSAAPADNKSQMLISYVPGEECRVAVVENGLLEEFHAENARSISRVGNIYVGTVTNVEPAIQAAFVDFGVEEHGFLHVTDVHPRYFPGEDEEDTTESIGRKTPRRERPPIQKCFKRGDQIEVQVLKEGVGTKGPTLTSYLSIPGRFLVMMPQMDKVGVSRKVEDEDERRKMREILDQLELPEGFGFILRTAGMDRNKTELKRDLAYLQRLWKDMENRKSSGSKPRLLYSESDLLVRALRDILTQDIDEVIIDHELALTRAARFLKIVAPRSKVKLLQFDGKTPLFHAYGIEQQIAQIHAREVPLPSGGRLVIDETEALVAIDVNSGKSRDSKDAETNAYHTNIEAVDAICRQLKLRDLGGIVINDLIDMRHASHRKDIEDRMRERLKRDRAKTTTLRISEFGILEMTRQRMRGSHETVHFAECPTCHGRGLLQKPDSVASDSLRNLAALLDQQRVAKVEMVVGPRVASELLSTRRKTLSKLERDSGKHVDVRVSETIAPDRITFYAYDDQGADIEIDRLPAPRPPRELKEWEFSPKDLDEDAWTEPKHEEPPEPADEPALEDTTHPIELEDELEDVEEGLEAGRAASGQQSRGEPREDGEGGRRRRRRRRGRRGRGGQDGEPRPAGDQPRSDQSHADQPRFDQSREQDQHADHERRDDAGDADQRSEQDFDAGDDQDRGQDQGPYQGQDRDDRPREGGFDQPRLGPDGQPLPPGEGGGRRRRRRRRRGRGRGGFDGAPGDGQGPAQGQAQAQSSAPSQGQPQHQSQAPAPSRGQPQSRGQGQPRGQAQYRDPDDFTPRGDSWDLTPEELARLRPGRTPAPAASQAPEPRDDDREDEFAAEPVGDARPADTAEPDMDRNDEQSSGDAGEDVSGEDMNDGTGSGDRPADDEGGGRRRRRRRRGRRGRGGEGAPQGADAGGAPQDAPRESPRDEAPRDPAPRQQSPREQAPRSEHEHERGPRGGYQKRVPEYKQPAADRPASQPTPEPKPEPRAEPKPAPAAAPTPAPAAAKPKFLYSMGRRKLAPTDALKNRPRE